MGVLGSISCADTKDYVEYFMKQTAGMNICSETQCVGARFIPLFLLFGGLYLGSY